MKKLLVLSLIFAACQPTEEPQTGGTQVELSNPLDLVQRVPLGQCVPLVRSSVSVLHGSGDLCRKKVGMGVEDVYVRAPHAIHVICTVVRCSYELTLDRTPGLLLITDGYAQLKSDNIYQILEATYFAVKPTEDEPTQIYSIVETEAIK